MGGNEKMAYREIDFNKVKGFNTLSEDSKERFIKIYQRHNSGQGTDYKEGYQPTKVVEEGNKFRVNFLNGEWLYYYGNGTWG